MGRKLEEQAKKYKIIFGANGCPVAIFSVPGGGGLVEEQVKEIPAPARRIALVAEAHELGHFGADKTAKRLWDLGFDWVGLLQDCEVITKVCRPWPEIMRSGRCGLRRCRCGHNFCFCS